MAQFRDLPVVKFGGGQHHFGVDAHQIVGTRQEPHISDQDVEGLLGLRTATGGLRQTLLVVTDLNIAPVSVARPVSLERVEAIDIFPLPPLVARSMAITGAKAIALVNGTALVLVDLQRALSVQGRLGANGVRE